MCQPLGVAALSQPRHDVLVRVEEDLGERLIPEHLLEDHACVERSLWVAISVIS